MPEKETGRQTYFRITIAPANRIKNDTMEAESDVKALFAGT